MKTLANSAGLVSLVLALVIAGPSVGQDVRHEVAFPDLPGYQTLVCDLHMHTVFSDGNVWPTVRVAEAWRQGLDAIAITDHIEYQPHRDDVPTNHNRPYDLAAGHAKTHNLLLVRAAEITRDTPPGHFNALFLSDANPLDTEEFLEAIQRANEQGAFVFWNHQAWKGEEKGRWLDVHSTLYEKGWLHGMEVANGTSYYPTAHRWCLEKNLTMLGNSDIHDPDLRTRSASDNHRTMTLVFARERTPAGLKEALTEGRAAVWFEDQIIGREEFMKPLFAECVQVVEPAVRSGRNVWVEIRNECAADIRLERSAGAGPTELTLPAGTTSLVKIAAAESADSIELGYTAAGWLIAPETGLPVVLEVGL